MGRRGEKIEGEKGIYQRDDGRYHVVATAKDPDKGKVRPKEKILEGEQTLERARELRATLKEEIATPEAPTNTPETSVTTLAHYCQEWMRAKRREVKPKTARTYGDALEKKVFPIQIHVSPEVGEKMPLQEGEPPHLGAMPVEEMERRHVKQWAEWAQNAEKPNGEVYATSTIRKWWRPFKSVLLDLEADRGLPEGYLFRRIGPLKTGRSGIRKEEALSRDQISALLEAAREVAPGRYAEICTLAYTGMRSGELWALKPDAVHLDEGAIEVIRSVSAGIVTDETKAGYDRVVPLHEDVVDVLEAHMQEQWRKRGDLTGELIFPSNAGTPRIPGSLKKALRNCCEKADGIDDERGVSPQTFRKTLITLLTEAGVDPLIVRRIVGHKSEAMRGHYFSPSADVITTTYQTLDPIGGEKAA